MFSLECIDLELESSLENLPFELLDTRFESCAGHTRKSSVLIGLIGLQECAKCSDGNCGKCSSVCLVPIFPLLLTV